MIAASLQARIGVVAFACFLASIPLANWMILHIGTVCAPQGPCLVPVALIEKGKVCGKHIRWLRLAAGERANHALREGAAEAVTGGVPAGVCPEARNGHLRHELLGERKVRSIDKSNVDNRHVSAGADVGLDLG